MSERTSVRLFFVGRTPEAALKGGEVALDEKSAQEGVGPEDRIYAIDVTVFASRVREVELWRER